MSPIIDSFMTGDRPAKLRYLPSDYEVLTTGSYVICAVTGDRIPLSRLRYWSAERQEAYRDCETATRRHAELQAKKG